MAKYQPYLDSKKSTNPSLYLSAKYKQDNKYFNNAYEFSNARFTNVPKTSDIKFGRLGYPKIKQNG